MSDAYHLFGGDLDIDAGGDLRLAGAPAIGQQRVLRRLLTNPGDDVWNQGYGAGLSRYVGLPMATAAILATLRQQMRREASVAQTPAPVIDLAANPDGTVSARIRYADQSGGPAQTASFVVGE